MAAVLVSETVVFFDVEGVVARAAKGLLVLFHCRASWEPFSAVCASERLFSRVNSLVSHDVSSLDECFVAESASEGFVAAVDSLVAKEVSSKAESSSAE